MPAARIVFPSRSDACCEPWPGWCAQPSGGRLRAIAILSAPSASPAAMRADVDHPTIPQGHMSMTTARYGRPRRVRTQAMPANRASSGPSALRSRSTRSGAAFACGAAGLAALLGRLAPPLVVPAQPLSRTMRAARSREVRTPERPSPAKAFGAPQAPRLAAWIPVIPDAGSASPSSRAPGPRDRRAQQPRRVALSAEHVSETVQAPSSALANANLAHRLRAYGCLPARKALAFKSISFSLFGRSFPRPSPRRPPAIWKGVVPCRRLRGVGPSSPSPTGSPGRRRARGRSPRRCRPAPRTASPPAA